MKRLLALLLLAATPAVAGDGNEVTILRGTSAPPTPWYEPPPPPAPPQPVVVYQPVIYPAYWFALPAVRHRPAHPHFRR